MNSFREYGPQKVEVECAFSDQAGLVAIELLPEDRTEKAEEISLLLLTPAHPRKEWSYLTRTPFQAGYRYRLQKRADESPSEWSEVRSPFERLQIEAPANTGGQ